MGGTEQDYVKQAFEQNWIVPLGPAVDEFEHRLQAYLGSPGPVVALSSGTAAIHMGLLLAGVKAGDEVIVQDLTFAASCNPVAYLGAKPVFVDSEAASWNLDPDLLEHAIAHRIDVTGRKPAAIVPVHLYGMPCRIDRVAEVAARYGIPVVEDAAEALGSSYKGRHCGTFGAYGAFSFNGNKIITTSGGGALVCPDKEMASRALFFATQAREKRPYYYHEHVGYNYRLSNVSAAIGCGQMEALPSHLERRRRIHALYAELLDGIDGLSVHDNPGPEYDSNFWLTTILLPPDVDPDTVRQAMEADNIETRLLWRPMHMQPVWAQAPFYSSGVGESLFARGLCLPSGSSLTDADIEAVALSLKKALRR